MSLLGRSMSKPFLVRNLQHQLEAQIARKKMLEEQAKAMDVEIEHTRSALLRAKSEGTFR